VTRKRPDAYRGNETASLVRRRSPTAQIRVHLREFAANPADYRRTSRSLTTRTRPFASRNTAKRSLAGRLSLRIRRVGHGIPCLSGLVTPRGAPSLPGDPVPPGHQPPGHKTRSHLKNAGKPITFAQTNARGASNRAKSSCFPAFFLPCRSPKARFVSITCRALAPASALGSSPRNASTLVRRFWSFARNLKLEPGTWNLEP
jgi:hypothetical protein